MTTKQQHQSGIVERVEFTHGGAGNQWTTISGVRYATFWDIKTKDWEEGDEVEFDVVSAPLWAGQAPLLQARNIRKAQPKVIYLTESEVRAHCEAARNFIRPRLDGVHGVLLPIDEDMPAEPQAAAAARAAEKVDITPSWGEWGTLYRRFAESGETKVLKELRSDFAKAMAAAEALKSIQKTLSDEQQKIVAEVLAREIGKQGY